jgi:hypothetical protein
VPGKRSDQGIKKPARVGAGSSVGVKWLVGQSVKVDQKSNYFFFDFKAGATFEDFTGVDERGDRVTSGQIIFINLPGCCLASFILP